MKESQQDFGLTAGPPALLEIIDAGGCAPPVYADNGAWAVRDGSKNIVFRPGLPTEAKARKAVPLYSGVVKYFPDALIAVAKTSFEGNEQHHPGKPLHWDKSKSGDHLDCLQRHLFDYTRTGDLDELGKVCWRALAAYQIAADTLAAESL